MIAYSHKKRHIKRSCNFICRLSSVFCRLILILVPQKIILLRIVGPYVFNGLVDLSFPLPYPVM